MFDWWVVQKRTIYLGIALLVMLMLGGGAALYVWKFGNPLKTSAQSLIPHRAPDSFPSKGMCA